MEKKKVILTLCRIFPVTHRKAGELTGFEGKLKDGKKIHTIRYNAKNVWDERYKGITSGKKYLSVLSRFPSHRTQQSAWDSLADPPAGNFRTPG